MGSSCQENVHQSKLDTLVFGSQNRENFKSTNIQCERGFWNEPFYRLLAGVPILQVLENNLMVCIDLKNIRS